MPSLSDNLIHILLVDKHALVRGGLRQLIEAKPGHVVVGEAGNRDDALAIAAAKNPDIILLELDSDYEQGLACIRQLLAAASKARLLLVTSESNIDIHQRAAQAGAMGVVLKDETPDVLIKAIGKVHAGEAWLDRMTLASVLTKLTRKGTAEHSNPETRKIALLSERERSVVMLIGEGMKNKEIGEKLSISEITVRHHLTSIFGKLQITDRLELIIYAYQNGLAQLPR